MPDLIKAVLFDLDNTLADTTALAPLRKNRNWKGAVNNLDKTSKYRGVDALLKGCKSLELGVAIVTTSVSFYAIAVCRHHSISYDKLVAYHDAPPKPKPDPFLKAAQELGVDPECCIGVGDDAPDALALASAGIYSVGAKWSDAFNANLKWDIVMKKPEDLLKFLKERSS